MKSSTVHILEEVLSATFLFFIIVWLSELLYCFMEGSSLALTRSPLESKHLVVGNREVFSTCEERALLSWWALISAPEIAVSFVIFVGML